MRSNATLKIKRILFSIKTKDKPRMALCKENSECVQEHAKKTR